MLCHDHNTVNKNPFIKQKYKVCNSKRKMLLNMFIGKDNVKRDFYATNYPNVFKKIPSI